MAYLYLALLWVLLAPASTKFVLQPGPSLQLPAKLNNYAIGNGAATKAAYDPQENFLYVIGYKADVLHIIDMTDPNSPMLLATKAFSMANMGLPDSVQVCRGGANREYLSITFESKDQQELSHVHLFRLLDATTVDDKLHDLKNHATLEGFDPRSSAWKKDCTALVVVSKGQAHEINGGFIDPPTTVDRLIPSSGDTLSRASVSIVEDELESASVRRVFQQCEGAGDYNVTSKRKQDLEATAITVGKDNMAYIIFQDNNAIGTVDLSSVDPHITYYNLGTKNWTKYAFDGSSDDGGIMLKSRTLRSFYQPGDVVALEVDGKEYLATADTGSIRQLSLSTCTFDESVVATDWNQRFSDGLTEQEIQKLKAEMNDTGEIGQLRLSKLRQRSDGWDPLFEGYDFVCTYGGRGFSILDPANNMNRVFDSGDDFERYFETSDATAAQTAVYNANVGDFDTAPSSERDKASPNFGPTPSAITVADINNTTQVLVIANGKVGGLYTYSVSSGLTVKFESFIRRGQPGLPWDECYNRDDDTIGEPYTSDLIYFEDQGQKTVVAVSSAAGAISIYRLEELP